MFLVCVRQGANFVRAVASSGKMCIGTDSQVILCNSKTPVVSSVKQTTPTSASQFVQWHPFSLFLAAAPLKMVFPKKGSLFFLGSLNN